MVHSSIENQVLKGSTLEPRVTQMAQIERGFLFVIFALFVVKRRSGGSGPSARPMDEKWVLNIQKQCRKADVSFFFKQWGGVNKKKAGRLLKGRDYSETPNIANAMCPA